MEMPIKSLPVKTIFLSEKRYCDSPPSVRPQERFCFSAGIPALTNVYSSFSTQENEPQITIFQNNFQKSEEYKVYKLKNNRI